MISPCSSCSSHFCYWFHYQPERCELRVTAKYLQIMYKLSRPKVADQEFPSDAYLPSTILRDRPWDMSIQHPVHPSSWLDPFLEDETSKVSKREFPETHSVKCEFCGKNVNYKTRKPVYNVCDDCKLRLVKSREKGSFIDILSRPESSLSTDDLVTPSLPSSMYSSVKDINQVTRFELTQMAPVDSRGGSGTRGTTVTDETIVLQNGKRRVRAAVWLEEQMRRQKKLNK